MYSKLSFCGACNLVCDLKLTALVLGIQNSTSIYSCPYGECYKVDTDTNNKTNKKGVYIPGPLRTCNNIAKNQAEWMSQTNGDRKHLKFFKNCEFPPMALRKDQVDKPVILFMKPDPLHINILGPPNDVLELLEELYPVEMIKLPQTFFENV